MDRAQSLCVFEPGPRPLRQIATLLASDHEACKMVSYPPIPAGSFLLIVLAGRIPDVPQAGEQMDVIMSIICGSEVGGKVGQRKGLQAASLWSRWMDQDRS